MSTETNKVLTRRYVIEPWAQGKLETFDELCAPNFVLHLPDGSTGSAQDLKNGVSHFRQGMPDLQSTIYEIVAEGDLVIYRWSMVGTHKGEFEGIKPTGKKVVSTGITILRFANGKVVDDRFESGSPSFQAQVS